MTTSDNDLRATIARLKPLLDRATPGPWQVIVDDCGPLAGRPSIEAPEELDCSIVHGDGFIQEFWRSARGDKEIHANAQLIVALRNAAKDLIAAAEGALDARALKEAADDDQ